MKMMLSLARVRMWLRLAVVFAFLLAPRVGFTKTLIIDFDDTLVRTQGIRTRAMNYPHAAAVLRALKQNGWNVLILTQGDRDVQRRRLQESGLWRYFDAVEIVDAKNERTYLSIEKKYGLNRDEMWVVGNSFVSDIEPALKAGLREEQTIWIQGRPGWQPEVHSGSIPDAIPKVKSLARLADLLLPPPRVRREKNADPGWNVCIRHDCIYGASRRDSRAEDILAVITADLLQPEYAARVFAGAPRETGHCYEASEAYYYDAGGKESGLTAQVIKHEGGSHWYLKENRTGRFIDVTEGQFKTPVPHSRGRGIGFQQRSHRTDEVLSRLQNLRLLRKTGR